MKFIIPAFSTILFACPLATAQVVVEETTTTEKTEGAATAEKKTTATPADPKKQPGSLAKMIADSPDFSILSQAIDAAGVTTLLGEKDVRTVFAPTNEAFGKLPKGTLDKLMLPENKEKLRSLLLYHVINGNAMTMALDKETEVTTVNGEKLELEITEKKMQADDAKIVNTNIAANNGIVLVVDKVLVPDSLDGFAGLDD